QMACKVARRSLCGIASEKTFLLYHTRRGIARKIVQNSRKNFFSEKKESVRLYQTEKSRKVERRCSLLYLGNTA
ncbi:hypothetical protein, partial [uncultured Ruminococcus sp.]|uniref:hypothetical protein n=1 Tax=uncultured Ruminococcus sp. TaxID=165186 RepID=UPI002596FB97